MVAMAPSQALGPPTVPVKPSTDVNDYRRIRLDNDMEVLLVHDANTDKAAASVDVRVGSLSDPPGLDGLAHFTEHMLFYGSESYPEEDAYSKFISDRGGMTNAYTSAESTNYHFDINHASFEGALDRFAQFFIAPLISEDGVEREVKAVDSEHGKNINSDMWRQMQLWRGAGNPAHPFTRFHTGNHETLMSGPKEKGVAVHEKVRKFWEARYSANVMRASLVSRHSLDELEGFARAAFSGIANKQLAAPRFTDDIVPPGQLGVLLKVVPERDWHAVEVQWVVPPEIRQYRAQPCGYLSHLLGHEGEGSVFALLKARGWAVELSAGESGMSFSAASLFSVNIVLTDEGHARVEEVLALLFDYLAVLGGPGGVSRAVWEENRALCAMRFDFSERLQPLQAAQSLAHAMHDYADRDLLLAMHHVPLDFEPEAIQGVLACMTPNAARIMWASKAFQGKTQEKEYFYGADFSREAVPEAWRWRWRDPQRNDALHLPAANPFISTDFAMQEESWGRDSEPRRTLELPLVTLWARPDTSFDRPKAAVFLGFAMPAAYTSPEAAVLTKLFARLLADALNELAYPASLAGLQYALDSTTQGFQLTASGFSHKLPELVHTVLARLADLQVAEDRFEVVREALTKDYAAMAYDQPYQRALYSGGQLQEARKWHVDDYAAVIGGLSAADLQAFIPKLLGRAHVTAYVTGNIGVSAAADLARHVQSLLAEQLKTQAPFPSQASEKRVVKLPAGTPVLFSEPNPNAANANSAVAISFQMGPDDLRRNALGQLAAQLAQRDAFHQLRTQQQLGYLVHMSSWTTLSVRSLIFIIQSTTHAAAHLDSAIEAFLQSFRARLAALPQSEFDEQVAELAKSKLDPPKRLAELAQRHWGELDGGTRVWDRPGAEVAALEHITLADLRAFFEEVVVGQRSRRKLSVHVRGAGELSGVAIGCATAATAAAAAPAAANGAGTETCAAKEAPKAAPAEPEAAAAAVAKPAAENGPPAKAAAAAAAPAKAATAQAQQPERRPAIVSPAALARMARVAADATGQRDAPPPGGATGQQQGALKTASLGNWEAPPGSAANGPVVKDEPPAQQAPAAGDGSAQQDGQPSDSTGVRAGSLGSWGAAQQDKPETRLVEGAPEQQPDPKSPEGNAAGRGTPMTALAAARMAGIAANTVAQRGEAQGEEEAAPETGLRPPSLGNWAGVPKRTLAAASAPAAAGQPRPRRMSLDRRASLDRRMSLDTVPEQEAKGGSSADLVGSVGQHGDGAQGDSQGADQEPTLRTPSLGNWAGRAATRGSVAAASAPAVYHSNAASTNSSSSSQPAVPDQPPKPAAMAPAAAAAAAAPNGQLPNGVSPAAAARAARIAAAATFPGERGGGGGGGGGGAPSEMRTPSVGNFAARRPSSRLARASSADDGVGAAAAVPDRSQAADSSGGGSSGEAAASGLKTASVGNFAVRQPSSQAASAADGGSGGGSGDATTSELKTASVGNFGAQQTSSQAAAAADGGGSSGATSELTTPSVGNFAARQPSDQAAAANGGGDGKASELRTPSVGNFAVRRPSNSGTSGNAAAAEAANNVDECPAPAAAGSQASGGGGHAAADPARTADGRDASQCNGGGGAAASTAGTGANGNRQGPAPLVVTDIWAFKRAQELWPSPTLTPTLP